MNMSDKPKINYSKYLLKLQVINLLLEAERRKLCVLQRELKTALEEGGSIKAKEHQKQELITAIQKIQSQYDNLEKECRQHAIGALKASNTRGIGKVRNDNNFSFVFFVVFFVYVCFSTIHHPRVSDTTKEIRFNK